jgi:hypothetical protein
MLAVRNLAVLTLMCSAILLKSAGSLDPITIKGKKFYYSNGNEFFVKGMLSLYPSFALARA